MTNRNSALLEKEKTVKLIKLMRVEIQVNENKKGKLPACQN